MVASDAGLKRSDEAYSSLLAWIFNFPVFCKIYIKYPSLLFFFLKLAFSPSFCPFLREFVDLSIFFAN